MPSVRVCVIGPDGKLTGPTEVSKTILSDAEWRRRLTPEQYRVTRDKGTEPAFCGGLLSNKEAGIYVCVCCNLPLFESSAKFESGTGWPSFFQPVANENVRDQTDRSHGMLRTEILCRRCDAHLGHVFEDGPRPTGLRYCLNSEAMRFAASGRSETGTGTLQVVQSGDPIHNIREPVPVSERSLGSIAEYAPAPHAASTGAAAVASNPSRPARAEAVFAGGCFWCVEAVFEQLDGVLDAISGYAGGTADTANYAAVSTGQTGHAEAVKIVYDPQKISYEELLKVHFATHDPTTLNRQGNDIGPQYRSAIFYASDREKEIAEAFLADLTDAKVYKRPIVTALEPLAAFYPAEAKHQDFVACNPHQTYVRAVALPKVEKVREKFKDLLK